MAHFFRRQVSGNQSARVIDDEICCRAEHRHGDKVSGSCEGGRVRPWGGLTGSCPPPRARACPSKTTVHGLSSEADGNSNTNSFAQEQEQAHEISTTDLMRILQVDALSYHIITYNPFMCLF